MTRRTLTLGIALAAALLWSSVRAGQGGSFDKLSAADRRAMQERFAKEIWPLMQRGGKDGCVGCHAGNVVSDLHLSGKLERDFPMLVKEGFFVPDDAGSLLGRITDKNPRRRMPLGKRPAWTDKEVDTLRAFAVELDKRQKK